MSISLHQPQTDTPISKALHDLFVQEWGEVDPFSNEKEGLPLPTPLIALSDDDLIGGLAFTRYPAPKTDVMALWVNALLVKPDFRKQGVSKRLIEMAMQQALMLGETRLYVYTHIPYLYESIGWVIEEQNEEHFVLSYSLA